MSDCICAGNWRAIIEETEPLFGRYYIGPNGSRCKLFGVMWADDDFYYAMWDIEPREFHLLTCVGSIENQGFKLEEAA